MSKTVHSLTIVVVSIFIFGCAGVQRKQVADLRNSVSLNQYEKAKSIVYSKKFYPDDKSILLRTIEQGLVEHYLGHYYLSMQKFFEARKISDKLFTVRIGKKITSMINDDSSDHFYPSYMVQSQIRFYLALDLFLLSQQAYKLVKAEKKDGKNQSEYETVDLSDEDRKQYLVKARATILEWDTFMEDIRGTNQGKAIFKNDVSLKILGAFIHFAMKTRDDHRIGLDLLRDAEKVLIQNYGIYSTFNKKYAKFKKDFARLYLMDEKTLERDYLEPTRRFKQITSFLEEETKLNKKKNYLPVSFIYEYDIVPRKYENKINIPIPSKTGIVRPTMIKLPELKSKSHTETFSLFLTQRDGKLKKEIPMVTLNPLSQIFYTEFQEELPAIRAKIVARYVAKQAVAEASSTLASKQDNSAAAGAFAALSLLSNISSLVEEADLRQWSTLPHELFVARGELPNGQYDVSLIKNNDQAGKTHIGILTINHNKAPYSKLDSLLAPRLKVIVSK